MSTQNELLADAGLTVAGLYDELTDGMTRSVRLDELVYAAAERVPGLVPTRAEVDAERERRLADKTWHRARAGAAAGGVPGAPGGRARTCCNAMLEPTPPRSSGSTSCERTGSVDLGPVRVTRQGSAGILELLNPRHLNAEDGVTLGPTETAVDLILLDPEIEVGVFRGGFVDHPRYAGERVFGTGINLTHLYLGTIDFLFFLTRDLGYVNKIYRGLSSGEEKLWIAAVERFAIGGHCQLLHVVDHVLATRGSRLYLPARKEGIIPGASNLQAAPVRRRSGGAPGDPVRARVDRGRTRRRDAVRRGRRPGRVRGGARRRGSRRSPTRDSSTRSRTAARFGSARSRSSCTASTWRCTRVSRLTAI